MKTALAIIIAVTFASAIQSALAQTALVDRQTGKYLGNLGGNKYDPNSTSNPYGQYGSKYSPDSINNKHGQYGSRYSADSPNNPYAGNPPAIVVPGGPAPVIEWVK